MTRANSSPKRPIPSDPLGPSCFVVGWPPTFTVNSATKITVKTPARATGTVDVRVTTKYGTSPVTSHDKYTFA